MSAELLHSSAGLSTPCVAPGNIPPSDPCTVGSPPLPDPHTTRIPTPQLCWLHPPDTQHTGIPAPQPLYQIQDHQDTSHSSALDSSPDPIPQLTGIPTLPELTALQALLSPSHTWEDHTSAPQIFPALQTLPGSRSVCNNWSPMLLEQAAAWHQTAASTSLPGTPPFRENWHQLYMLPR
jgi:hypothetical protein